MKILVYDVAAEEGGALFVLKNFYNEVLEKAPKDTQWYFMVSNDAVSDTENVQVLRYDKVKRSWLHRFVFETFELPGIIESLGVDLVISLQNMPVKRCKRRQLVYLHQSLQYCPKRFSLLKAGERGLAVRQMVISWLIKNAMPQAEHIFVQTQWIKDATVRWLRRPEEDITVVPVTLSKDIPVKEFTGHNSRTFFYPARAEEYKNHRVVIEACKELTKRGVTDYRVLFTCKPEDSAYAAKLQEEAKGLPVKFIGGLSYEQVWEYYSKTILLFPSYLETCGLPMVEAKRAGARVLASDMPFSHEALDNYPNAGFFPYENAAVLADLMQALLEGKAPYVENPKEEAYKASSLLESMLSKV